MECEHPVYIDDPRRPAVLDRFGVNINKIAVACGRCAACQSNHRKMWFFRLKVESDKCVVSYVVTLTYNDLDVPDYIEDQKHEFRYHPIQYRDIQLFNKRLRKALGKFRFFAVCEYGPEKFRPHYHICYFFDTQVDRITFEDAVFKNWFSQSRITIDTTNDKAANYILSYCLSKVGDDIPKEFWPKIRCSNRPFIGAGLLDNQEFLDWLHIKRSDISNYLGYKTRLPRIFRDKVFSDEEKRFIQEELGRAIDAKHDRQELDYQSKLAKYGHDKANDYYQQSRDAFNKRVMRSSKIKSIK